MADIINLRQARKAKTKQSKEKKAEENRIKFGRTKAEKQREFFEKDKLNKSLDQSKRDDD
jgi:hypothetical protein